MQSCVICGAETHGLVVGDTRINEFDNRYVCETCIKKMCQNVIISTILRDKGDLDVKTLEHIILSLEQIKNTVLK